MTAAPDPPARLRTAVVVGTGLIGTSVGLALRRYDVDVRLVDRDPVASRRAADLGAGSTRPLDGPADIAVVAVPPPIVATVAADALRRGLAACVTDVASIKAAPQHVIERMEGVAARFVGGHPLAGRERSGPGAARGDLFEGRPWVLTPGSRAAPEAVARATALVRACGAEPVIMGADAHDAAVALVSHAPQVLASLLAARLNDAPPEALRLAGAGLRDTTRVAASDPQLWSGILAGNAGPIASVLRALRADLDQLMAALDRHADLAADPQGQAAATSVLRGLLAAGREGRERLPGKHGAPPTTYAGVPVVVPDRPGELARLFADTGAAGVNVEDVEIEHSPGQPVGLVEIAVRPAARPRLVQALRARGWTVHADG